MRTLIIRGCCAAIGGEAATGTAAGRGGGDATAGTAVGLAYVSDLVAAGLLTE